MKPSTTRRLRPSQLGGTLIGLIIGLLLGLGIALAVALYIAKVPVPFIDKVPHRTAEQDAAEIERNKNWDPNAPLAGKPAPIPNDAASDAVGPAPTAQAPAQATTARPTSEAASEALQKQAAAKQARSAAPAPQSSRDAAAILAGQSPASSPAAADPFIYFVQAGAYSNADDAEQQRGRLAMQGLTATVSERDQGGHSVHRVRLGPFDSKDEARAQQERLKADGADAVLVRVERPH